MSCAGNGYLTGNMLVAFPFEDGQCLPWPESVREEAQLMLNRCFVDACVSLSAEDVSEEEWPSVVVLSASLPVLTFSLNACGMSKVFSVSSSGSAVFPVVSGSCDFGSYVISLSSEGIRGFCEFCESNNISPPVYGSSSPSGRDGGLSLRLCPRCVSVSPKGLKSLRVYDGVSPIESGPHFVLSGDVAIVPGNNMEISDPSEDGFIDNGLRIGAVPGAGMGQVPCVCEESEVPVSNIAGRDGHVRFFNDTCYDLEPVTTDGTLRIHAKCTACCTCKMYESIVNDRLRVIADSIRSAKKLIGTHLDTYESGVAAFNERMSKPRIDDIQMSLTGMPVSGNTSADIKTTKGNNVKGMMLRCSFASVIRNTSYVAIVAKIHSMSANDRIVEASASWTDEGGGPLSVTSDNDAGESKLIGIPFVIYPGRSLVITFVSRRLEMTMHAFGRAGEYTASISVGFDGPEGSVGVLSRSIRV